jgi:uncharacterized protein YjbI with pentapeptide repeats
MSTLKLTDCEHVIDASNANFGNSSFEDVRFADSRFNEVTFEAARFDSALLDGCHFDTVSMIGVSISNGRYDGMTIDGIAVTDLLEQYRRAHDANGTAARS